MFPEHSSKVQLLISDLNTERENFLERARDNSAVTIPDLIRESGDNSGSDTETPWESVGAYLVNNLTNKIALSLFPQGVSWVEFEPSRDVLEALREQLPNEGAFAEARLALTQRLAYIEQSEFGTAIAKDGDAAILTKAVKHLLVAGSYGLGFDEATGKIRGIPLNRFWTARGADGKVYASVVEDPTRFALLDDDIKAMVALKRLGRTTVTDDEYQMLMNQPVSVFTYQELKGGRWHIHEEVEGQIVPGSETTSDEDLPRFIFPVYELRDDENFGRSYVEYYVGDLEAIDGQSQVVQEGSAAAAMFIRLVRPGGVTSKTDLEEAANLDIIAGNAEDVTTLQSEKTRDFQASISIQERIISRLERAFLLTSSIQRDAERVTRAEIVTLAQELENQLGGAYALMGITLQAPYAVGKLYRLQKHGRMTDWQKDLVDVTVLTGAATLGRAKAMTNTLQALQVLVQVLGPQWAMTNVNPEGLTNLVMAGYGATRQGVIYTKEEAQQNMRQQALTQTATAVAPEVVRQVGNAANTRIENQQQQTQE